MFVPDPEKAYQLMEVTNLDGSAKTSRLSFYEERVGCIGKLELQVGNKPEMNCLFVKFCRKENGKRTNLRLRTSPLIDIEQSEDFLVVTTSRSIYIFTEALLPATEYLQEKNLVELYLTDTDSLFCEGVLYDGKGATHALNCVAHEGMFEDTFLLLDEDQQIVCRYCECWQGISFYRAIGWPDADFSEFLVHNESEKPLEIRFEAHKELFIVPSGESLRIPNLQQKN